MSEVPATPGSQIRRPRQRRSQERFEAILDAAERLLADREPDTISIYTLAEAAEMSPPSIYHFFPDAQHVFVALSERYYAVFAAGMTALQHEDRITTWQELLDVRFEGSRAFMNGNAAARKILLGAASSWTIRARDLEVDRTLAGLIVAELDRLFVMPAIPGIVDRMTETIVIIDALWALAAHKEGYISDEAEVHVRRARLAHMRTYLPEWLVRRPAPAGPAQEVEPGGLAGDRQIP